MNGLVVINQLEDGNIESDKGKITSSNEGRIAILIAQSREAKEQLRRPPKTEIISTKKDDLKNIPSFILKVWPIVDGNYYEMEFRYPQAKNLYS